MIEVRNNHSAFIRELLGDAYVDQLPPERFELRAFSDGYRITEWGEVIATFHGPRFDLAAGLLRNLKAEAARSLTGYADSSLRSDASASIEPSAAVLS